jgi:hypothetical protein
MDEKEVIRDRLANMVLAELRAKIIKLAIRVEHLEHRDERHKREDHPLRTGISTEAIDG